MNNSEIMAEVDAQISKILKTKSTTTSKEKENVFCNATNLQTSLEQISQELDYLDVNYLKSQDLETKKGLQRALIQLTNSTDALLKLHKETQIKYQKNCDKNASNQSEIVYLRKINESLQKDLKKKDVQIKIQNEQKYLTKLKSDDCYLQLQNAKKELTQLKKEYDTLSIRHKFDLQRSQNEANKLEQRYRKKLNENSESSALEMYENFAQKDKNNRQIIEKLQINNHELLEEIVTLRDQVSRK